MFLDTSGLLCLFDRAESEFANAVDFFNAASSKTTTNYVLAEFVALALARRLSRSASLEFVIALQDSEEVNVVYVDKMLHQQGLVLLQARLDKGRSLCDAVSFEVMRDRVITDALTTDHHFEQAGFRKLLKA
jgi:predicted nucleic acid-binding protein